MTQAKPYSGIFPIAPVPFHDNGDLDLDGTRRVLDCMIDQGVDGICILANFSEQFLCSHYSTRIAVERGRIAAQAGAAMLMLMPPYHGALLKADEAGILAQLAAVAEAARIPIMLQDAPLSGVSLPVPFLVRLAHEVPLVQYFKIEVPGTAAKLRALIAAGG